jgi:hypothetical protein
MTRLVRGFCLWEETGELAGESFCDGAMPGKGLVAESDGLVRWDMGFLA